MKKEKLAVFDFDDTIVQTTKHICQCYSAVTGDVISNMDFVAEFTWDNVPRYKDLFRAIITAIQDDPSKLELMEGFEDFIAKLNSPDIDVLILSKRSGLKQVREYMKQITNIPIQYALVRTVPEKVKVMERAYEKYKKIYLFEDRMDAISGDMLDYCTNVYMPNRTWNMYQTETEKIKKFDSYIHLFQTRVTENNKRIDPIPLFS